MRGNAERSLGCVQSGRLALTEPGLAQRDRFVIESVRGRGIPLVIVLAGGYAATRQRTAQLHTHVFRAAADFERATPLRLETR